MSMICLAYQDMQQKLTRQLIFFNAQKITYALVYFFFPFISHFSFPTLKRKNERGCMSKKIRPLNLSSNTDIYVNIASM